MSPRRTRQPLNRAFRPLAALPALLLMAATTLPPDAPVADAVQRGDLEQVRALVRDGADVNAAQGDGMTALHWAAVHGVQEAADLLLYAGANVESTTRLGAYTPLHLAAREGSAGVIRSLLRAGSDAVKPSGTGTSPLHFAAASGSTGAVQAILEAGAEVDIQDGYSGRTPLMFATAAGRTDAVRVLLEAGADPSLRTEVHDYVERSREDDAERKQRAKMLAAARGDDATSRASLGPYAAQLQATAADPAAATNGGQPEVPATTTVPGERKTKKAATPDPDAPTPVDPDRPSKPAAAEPDPDEPQPLSYSDLVGRQGGLTALHYAARDGRAEEARLLLDAGADIDEFSGGDRSTPLLMAVINGHYDLALAFLERGADPNLLSEDGAGPLFAVLNNRWAHRTWYPQPTAWRQQRASYLDLMKALLDAGADPNERLETHIWYTAYNAGRIGVDFGGATPFWRAAYSLDVDGMRLLASYGADPDIMTRKPAERRRGGDDDEETEEDPSGLPPVPSGGPGVHALHAASGVGYGTSRVGQQHVFRPDGWLPAVTFLIEEMGVDVNVRDMDGYTALHNAAARGDDEMIRYLASKGADATLVSRRGQTTADMANGPQQRVQPFPETIALLMELGSENNDNCQSC